MIALILIALGVIAFLTYGLYINFIKKNNAEAIKFNLGITIYMWCVIILNHLGIIK